MRDHTETQIKSLTEKEKVRLRPDVWLQSHDLNAVKHSLVEVLGNSIDEASMGYGSTIKVKRYSDNSLEVTDNGRGIPMDFNEKEQEYNWKLIFLTLFAGGKYDDSAYEMSVGLNGVGLTVVQFSSEYMNVEVKRNGKRYLMDFEKGDPVTELRVSELENPKETGSRIRWLPDKEVFTDIEIEDDYFLPLLEGMALASGVTFEFEDELSGESRVIEALDYEQVLEEETKGKSISDLIFMSDSGTACDTKNDADSYKYLYKIGFCFTEKGGKSRYFHNMVEVDKRGSGGIHSASVYFAVAKGLSEVLERSINIRDVVALSDKFSCYMFTRSGDTSYDGQAKRSVLNKGLEGVLKQDLSLEVTKLFQRNKELQDYFRRILDLREKAKQQEMKIERDVKKIYNKMNEFDNAPIDKFADCRGSEGRELYIVEGDSAFGSCLLARDSDRQAITSVRGKIKNCLKADVSQIASNDIILRLIKIINEPVEIQGLGKVTLGDIREWEKFVICTDADEDGFQIRTLILAMFYRLYPSLLKTGRVYIAESPLFEIEMGKEVLFAYTEGEKEKIVSELEASGIKYTLNRSKGLGENNPDMMWLTTMNPSTRRLIQVVYDDEEREEITKYTFDALLGDDLEERKLLINDYMKNIDIVEVLT